MKDKVKAIEADVFVHETEDQGKIEEAIKNLLPDATITEEKLHGHYGTTIKKIKLIINGHGIEGKLNYLLSKLGFFEKGEVFSKIMDGLERNKIYIRLDKQELIKNLIKINGDNQIKIIITFFSEKDVRDYLAEQG